MSEGGQVKIFLRGDAYRTNFDRIFQQKESKQVMQSKKKKGGCK